MKTTILLCAHKEVKLPKHNFFLPVQAGTVLSDVKLSYQPDDEGEHISHKNRNYCELTAHYWAWRNLKGTDIIGLSHYRRYFNFKCKHPFLVPDREFTSVHEFLSRPYDFPDFGNIFKKFDIILPSTRAYPYNMALQYSAWHIVDDWRVMKEVIRELSPEYIPSFEKVLERNNAVCGYNMFVTKWEHFDAYSEWLFKILFEVEKRIKISAYPVQARVFGYMSERLISVFCDHHHLRVKRYPLIVPIEDFAPWQNPSPFRYLTWKLRNNLASLVSTKNGRV